MLTALAIPPAGYLGWLLAGHVDSASAAALAGVVTGAVLGLGQWLLLRRRGVTLRWASATAAALGIGLTVGAAVVGFETDRVSLAVMGAVSGLAVGIAQARAVRSAMSSVLTWGGTTGALWALGWIVSSFVDRPGRPVARSSVPLAPSSSRSCRARSSSGFSRSRPRPRR